MIDIQIMGISVPDFRFESGYRDYYEIHIGEYKTLKAAKIALTKMRKK